MAAAAVWGVLQLFAVSWPTRSVRLPTLLLALAVGVYGCGVATALVQLAYTRIYADQSGQSLLTVVNTTSYTVAPWVEELIKFSPLLLAGLSPKVRRQWGLTDFVVLGAALGAGFGLLEAVLRYGLDADRAMARGGGWIIPDSLSPPYVPGLGQVLTAWLPAPFSQLDLGGPPGTETFSHLVFTAMAGFGVGLLWRTRRWSRLLSAFPIAAAVTYHTVNNYAVQKPTSQAAHWLESLNGKAWAAPLVCLAVAMAVDLRRIHRGKRSVPGVLLASERVDGDSLGALLRYAAWRPPWSLLIALRYVRLRRSLLYAVASAPPDDTEELRRVVAGITARIEASDNPLAWRALDIRALLKAARAARGSQRRWLLVIPCVLMLPSLLFLGVGSFTSTAGLQKFFSTGSGPKILMGFGIAALAWIAYQLTTLLRTWRTASAQPLAEPLAVHRFRLGTALGAATTGTLLLWRALGDAGPAGRTIRTFHLLDALNTFLAYLGFALLLLSLLALFPPGGLALAGAGAVGALTAEAALNAGLLGTAGIVLMGLSASNGSGGDYNAWPRSKRKGRVKPRHRADVRGDEGKNLGGKSEAHTIDRHVDKTIDGMRSRLRQNPGLEADSRYVDVDSAQRFTDRTLAVRENQRKISDWLANGAKGPLRLEAEFDENTGLHLTRYDFTHGQGTRWVKGVRVILKADSSAASGYRVLTSYPQP
ncbi:RNase A-like domain-containing protein [Streptomyces sp. NBC_00078]|uniref:RNase A-like domain-containing protein n=1 Tax=unclassified Streptomyces TaxID=2593676 RepID=UPI002255A026|nr:RNase A-like domain-containing protein [Streptomyces sp. NBC_00078]MCX5421109.1 PrsW family glutamic-type intramembrane protease [Streptomyces sp. NBC_00078]